MFAYELVGREAFEGLEPPPEVVGADEVGQMLCELVVVLVMEAFDRRVLDRAVPLPGSGLPANRERDPLNLAAPRENSSPDCFLILAARGVFDLGQPVFDLMLAADAVEDVFEGINMPFVVGELDAIIRCPAMVCVQTMRGGEHDVEPVGHGCDQVAQERGSGHFPGLLVQFHEGELGGAVPSRAFSMPCQATDGDEQVKFTFRRLNLSDINVEVAERVGLERLLGGLVALDLGEARDVVALQTAVQR